MSFCSVPANAERGTPRFSAAAINSAQITGAGLLIVIEVVILSKGKSCNRISMSLMESTATPHEPNSPAAQGSSWS